jgi:hypothetical protein
MLRPAVFLWLQLCAIIALSQEPLQQMVLPDAIPSRDSIAIFQYGRMDLPLPAWHSMITHLPVTWEDAYRIAFQPVQFRSIIGVGALTGVLIATDPITWRWTKNFYDASPSHRSFADVCVYMGDGTPHFGAAAAFALFGAVTGDRRAIRTSSQIAEALVGTALVVHTLKRITGRQRPSRATHPRGVWDCFPSQREYNRSVSRFDAFPSGHLSTTVATLTVIMENYPEATWLRPISYTAMGLVAFGLVNKGMHWYSDFPLAFAIGHLIGMAAAHPDGDAIAGSDPEASPVTITPMLAHGQAGVRLDIVF